MNHSRKTIVIIGGGAAGFFSAINIAEKQDAEVIILEKSAKLLSKVKISGGGRCNVTHNNNSISQMSRKYPRGEKFVKKTFTQFFVKDTISWFADKGVHLHTEADNRMFPESNDSASIISCFLNEASKHAISIKMNHSVTNILPNGEKYNILVKGVETIVADVVVIATGGFPKLEMFDFLYGLKHTIIPPVPSLFTFNIPKHPITQFMGLSVPNAQVRLAETKLNADGPLLITHWGLSGPAVLKLSAYGAQFLHDCNYDFKIKVNWTATYNEETLRTFLSQYKTLHAQQKVINIQALSIPQRLWAYLVAQSDIEEAQKWGDLSAKLLNKLIKNICEMEFHIKGKTTFKEEFVTAGGVDLAEIDSNTMMSKFHKNIYFIGEVLNVDGITGGFNFQNAWTTAFIAAKNIGQV